MARERLERPFPGERQDGPARLLRVLLASVVGHVLAEPFLAGSREADLVVLRVNSELMVYE